LSFIRFDIRSILLALGICALPAAAQDGPQAPAPVAAQAPAATSQSTTPAAAPKSTVPDYPDPRTFTIGVFYWFTGPGTNPGVITGRIVRDNETLDDLGKAKRTPGVQISFPISRTGELKFEGFVTKGDGNAVAVNDPFLLGTQFTTGDKLVTQYSINSGKIYLDDLLFPHKFPVSKFRLKSLWEVQYVRIKPVIDLPPISTGTTATATKSLILPTFGIAAEYQVAPHVLFRVAGSGFGLYHRSDIWDGEATLSYRINHVEVVGGAKAFHFKTSPNKDEYYRATLAGAFAGVRWHW